MNEERSERGAKIAFLGEADVVDDGHRVQHSPDVYVQSHTAKKPPEQQQIMEDMASLRVSHACRHVERLDSSPDSAAHESAPRAPPPRPRGT